jgi:hypothetical protein
VAHSGRSAMTANPGVVPEAQDIGVHVVDGAHQHDGQA